MFEADAAAEKVRAQGVHQLVDAVTRAVVDGPEVDVTVRLRSGAVGCRARGRRGPGLGHAAPGGHRGCRGGIGERGVAASRDQVGGTGGILMEADVGDGGFVRRGGFSVGAADRLVGEREEELAVSGGGGRLGGVRRM